MEPDAVPADDNSLDRSRPAPSMHPSISKSPSATIRRRSAPPSLREIRVPTIAETPGYRSTHPSRASNASRLSVRVDVGRPVSSVAPLAICWRSNIPALLERLADLRLREFFPLGKIFAHVAWLTVFRDKLRRLYVFRFPIEIKNLLLRPQKIFRMPMTFEAPRHAMRLA